MTKRDAMKTGNHHPLRRLFVETFVCMEPHLPMPSPSPPGEKTGWQVEQRNCLGPSREILSPRRRSCARR